MDINKLANSIKYGIPHSVCIDKILSLRNPDIDIDYFSIYKVIQTTDNSSSSSSSASIALANFTNSINKLCQTLSQSSHIQYDPYQNMFSNCNLLSPHVFDTNSEKYVLPMFSFDKTIFCLAEDDFQPADHNKTLYHIIKYSIEDYWNLTFIKEASIPDNFQDISYSVEEFENLLMAEVLNNNSLIKHFIERAQ